MQWQSGDCLWLENGVLKKYTERRKDKRTWKLGVWGRKLGIQIFICSKDINKVIYNYLYRYKGLDIEVFTFMTKHFISETRILLDSIGFIEVSSHQIRDTTIALKN